MKIAVAQKTTASIFFQIDMLGRNGRCIRRLPRTRNLILNSLLDQVGSGNNQWLDAINNVAVGIGALTTKRASGAITISASGGNLLASAGFFSGADVGRILQLDTGERYLIATAPTSTTATSTNLTNAAASPGAMHYVNLTGLVNETERSATVAPGGTKVSVWDGGLGTMTHTVILLTPILATARVYSEIGWSWNSGAGTALAGCAPIAPSVSLGIGQRLRVTISIVVKPTPIISTPVSAGLAVGNILLEKMGSNVGRVNVQAVRLGTANTALSGPSTSSEPAIGTTILAGTTAFASYTNGTYKRTLNFQFADSLGAITANSLRLEVGDGTFGGFCSARILLSSPLVKTANDRVDGSFEYSWDRELVN